MPAEMLGHSPNVYLGMASKQMQISHRMHFKWGGGMGINLVDNDGFVYLSIPFNTTFKVVAMNGNENLKIKTKLEFNNHGHTHQTLHTKVHIYLFIASYLTGSYDYYTNH